MNLKRVSRLLLAVLLTNLISCAKEEVNVDDYLPLLQESYAINSMVENLEARASSQLYKAMNIVNRSGMSGNGSYMHLHTSSSPRDNMYLSQVDESKNYIDIVLDNLTQLGRLYIYNYNSSMKIDCSVKEFEVLYSYDEETYYKFDDVKYELSKNDGDKDVGHSLISGKDYIDLKGLTCKSIRLNFLSNYGGRSYGLSEVRLFRYKSEAKEGNLVSGEILRTEVNYSKSASNIINNLGMSKVNSVDAKMSNNPTHMYKSTKKSIVIELDGNYPIKEINFFNYNAKDNLDSGVKDVKVSFSTDYVNYEEVGSTTLEKGTGENYEKKSGNLQVDNKNAQFVKLEFESNYGGSAYGLSEVQFVMGKGYVSEPNIELTGLFSSYNGWSGADGIFGVRLNGDQSISDEHDSFFHFSDTYFGAVNPVNKHRENPAFKNNSFGYYKDNKMSFITDYEHISPIKDENRSSADAFNWLGDGFVIGNHYYVHALYIAKEGVLGFEQKGEDLVRFDILDNKVDLDSRVTIKDENSNKLCYVAKDGSLSVIFGSAVFENTKEAKALNPDGYIYNFGYRDEKNASYFRGLVLSRVKAEDVEDFSKYEYLSETGWQDDITKTKPLIDRVSCEMSVTEINDEESEYYGKFLLTYEKDTIGDEICVAYADSLGEEFKDSTVVYSAIDTKKIEGTSHYNAKMHPTLSTIDNLVITYNLNESVFGVNSNNADVYHPRFLNLFRID